MELDAFETISVINRSGLDINMHASLKVLVTECLIEIWLLRKTSENVEVILCLN